MILVTHLRLLVVALVPALARDLTRQLSLDRSTGVTIMIQGFSFCQHFDFQKPLCTLPSRDAPCGEVAAEPLQPSGHLLQPTLQGPLHLKHGGP